MRPRFFADPAAWRAWLASQHASVGEVWVGFWKRATGKPSITWPESVDGALCFGWIDGVRKSIDERSYQIRFTPRRPGSIWSRVNVRRMEALIAAGLVHEAGLAAFRARDEKKAAIYAYEREHAVLAPAETRALEANRAAWKDWQARPPGYRRVVTYWVAGAKRPETRARRLAKLIECSAAGRPVGPMLQAEKFRSSTTPRARARPARAKSPPDASRRG